MNAPEYSSDRDVPGYEPLWFDDPPEPRSPIEDLIARVKDLRICGSRPPISSTGYVPSGEAAPF